MVIVGGVGTVPSAAPDTLLPFSRSRPASSARIGRFGDLFADVLELAGQVLDSSASRFFSTPARIAVRSFSWPMIVTSGPNT